MFKTLFKMAANIYGYQGVHTPLESVTQGQYTLADYTSMRTELTARFIALENAGGFVPTNVTITGYLNVVPGGGGQGKIYTPSSIQCESILIQGGGAIIEADLQVGGSVIINNGLSVGGVITGDGSGISGVVSEDPTKLPLIGGTLTGELSIETDNGQSATPSLKVKDTIGGQSINVEPSAGGGSYSALTQAGDALIHVQGGGGSNTGTLTLASWASIMSGVRITPTQVIIGNGGAGGLGGIPTASAVFSGSNITLQGTLLSKDIEIQAGSSISGDGSGLSGIVATDSTKLPLIGGTLTGTLFSRDIQIEAPYGISGDGSGLSGIVDDSKLPLVGGTLTGTLYSTDIQVQNGFVISGDGSGLFGVSGEDSSKLPLIGGTMTGTLFTKDVQIENGYGISGDGSGLLGVLDATKLPLAGGILTGTLTCRAVEIQSNYSIKGNGSSLNTTFTVAYDQALNENIVPAASTAKNTHIILNYQSACVVRLTNLGIDTAIFPDNTRTITITKKGIANGDYILTLYLPIQAGLTWAWATPSSDLGTSSIQMGLGIFSYTFHLVRQPGGGTACVAYLISKV